jgi:hypothetical protein
MSQDNFAVHVLQFLAALNLTVPLPRGVEVLNPYEDKLTFQLCEQFYTKYYSDTHQRTMIIGINPGRFGAGLTGIPFTDPIKLETVCGIKNNLAKKAELSADFIYTIIQAYGGPAFFYNNFYFTSVSPLGFTKAGKNLNYYDDNKLTERLKLFILDCMQRQLNFGIHKKVAFCLGEGDNYKFLSQVNDQYQFFEKITPLAHPRFIMQYKRKSLHQYIDRFMKALSPHAKDVS